MLTNEAAKMLTNKTAKRLANKAANMLTAELDPDLNGAPMNNTMHHLVGSWWWIVYIHMAYTTIIVGLSRFCKWDHCCYARHLTPKHECTTVVLNAEPTTAPKAHGVRLDTHRTTITIGVVKLIVLIATLFFWVWSFFFLNVVGTRRQLHSIF